MFEDIQPKKGPVHSDGPFFGLTEEEDILIWSKGKITGFLTTCDRERSQTKKFITFIGFFAK